MFKTGPGTLKSFIVENNNYGIEYLRKRVIPRSNKKRKNLSYMGLYGKYDALEKEITDRDTEWLVWFVKERGVFWT